MALFILGIVIGLIGLVGLVVGKIGKVADRNGYGAWNFNLRWVGGPLFLLALLFLVLSGLRTVSTGTEGVTIVFGQVKTNIDPGAHWVAPWTEIKELPTRTTAYTMDSHPAEGQKSGDDSIAATTLGGAQVNVDSTLLYHISPKDATGVYRNIGAGYVDIIRSTARTDIRTVFGAYDPIAASTTSVAEISAKVEAALVRDLGARGIVVEQFQLRQVELPATLRDAVQAKLAQQQKAEQATYALQQAQVDAQTKVAAAKGDADSNALRSRTLTPAVLCEDFIQALASKMPGTLLTAGPCAAAEPSTGNTVLLNVPAGTTSGP